MALVTSSDFRERLQAIQRGLAQQYRQGTTNVSTSSSEPNSRVTMPQQPESSQLETEPQIEIDIKSEPFDSLHGTTRCFDVARMDPSYHHGRSGDADSYSRFMSPEGDGNDKPFVLGDNSQRSWPFRTPLASQTQSNRPKRSRHISPPTIQDAPEPKRIRPTLEHPRRSDLSDLSQQLHYMDDVGQERLIRQQDTIHDLQLQVKELQEKDLEQSQELIRLRSQATQCNTASQQIEIHRLRTNVRNLSNEAKARELVIQEYLSGWTRAKSEAAGLQSQLIDETRKMGGMRKMVEALRRKSDRTEKDLNRTTKERDRVVDAVWEILKFEAIEKMASCEFGKFGEALIELKGMLPKERKSR